MASGGGCWGRPGHGKRSAAGERFPVAISFNDDLRSHAEVALPALRRAGLTATFCLPGASLSRTQFTPTSDPLLLPRLNSEETSRERFARQLIGALERASRRVT